MWIDENIGDAPSYGEICAPYCRFCFNQKLVKYLIKDHWIGISSTLERIHEKTILEMAQIHGDFILREMKYAFPPDEKPACLSVCEVCGWWHVSKEIYLKTRNQIWFIECGVSASLRKLNSFEISFPLEETRRYLLDEYEYRYDLHPRHFEEVVASVFSSHGFEVSVSNYTADGGIDIVLCNSQNEFTAVQVKRRRATIEVAFIRELIGAMIINGYTNGIFVTTSNFQSGCKKAVEQVSRNGLYIELIDGENFFKKLKIARANDFNRYCHFINDNFLDSLELKIGFEYYCMAL